MATGPTLADRYATVHLYLGIVPRIFTLNQPADRSDSCELLISEWRVAQGQEEPRR
jgi:hypothetical protein